MMLSSTRVTTLVGCLVLSGAAEALKDLPRGPDPLKPAAPRAGAPRPHIVLYVVDDLGRANLGAFAGNRTRTTHTPHREGIHVLRTF